AKYDAEGPVLWARHAGGDRDTGGVQEGGIAVAADSTGAAYVLGIFSGTTIFGPGEPNETRISSSTILDPDDFLARFAADAPVTNHAPVAIDQSVTTMEDPPVAITLAATDADGDPLTIEIVIPPVHGVLRGTPPQVTYTPNADSYGTDSFTFKAFDGREFSNTATVAIEVSPVNDAPLADNQTLTTIHDTPLPVILTPPP